MTSTHRWPAALSALLALALTGCAPPAAPDPEPAFATEAEAFAAAEKTYRAYVDALNEVDLSDPETFEAVYAWTTGDLYASDRTSFSNWHAQGVRKAGIASVISVQGVKATTEQVEVQACYDVSGVEVLDSSGSSLVDPARPAVQALSLGLVHSRTATGLSLHSITPAREEFTC